MIVLSHDDDMAPKHHKNYSDLQNQQKVDENKQLLKSSPQPLKQTMVLSNPCDDPKNMTYQQKQHLMMLISLKMDESDDDSTN
jgi:hypothetical protein